MKNLIKKIQNTCWQYDLWEKGSGIVLGVSGGPDSVAMLDVLARLQKKYDLSLIIAHINYGLRGKDSELDEKFVRELAEKYGIEIFVFSPYPAFGHLLPKGAKGKLKKALPSENELRNVRYEFFEKIRQENNFDAIAVAHNADDQVETFLMRIIRGSGMDGLTAMQYKNKKIIRPLLSISRAEILEHLKNNKLKYRTDKTNLESKFLRNKIRNKLLPALEKDFNPQIKKTIFDSVVSISEDADFLNEVAEKYANASSDLEVGKFKKMHLAILRRVLRQKLAAKKGDLKNIEAAHIAEILKVIKSTKNKNQVVSLKGLKIIRKGDKLSIEKMIQ